MDAFFGALEALNAITLSVPVLATLLAVGVLFTLWSRFCQYRSLTHGVSLITGRGIDTSHGQGALTHFQALSAALSGTVGLGNIAGVAIAVEFGGPGAVFWMWMVGLAGMALKTTEVTLSMLYRDLSNPEDPHGGTMFVCRNGLGTLGGRGWATLGKWAGGFFCLSMLTFAVTGGNMFQAWSVADTTQAYFGVPTWVTGLVLAVLVALVMLGGVKRLGKVADKLVPVMCGVYVVAGLYVLVVNNDRLPDVLRLIVACAFSPAEAGGAFTGATLGMAFIFGMKRALFSSESGLGTAPIAHSAVKTPEPVTEGVVAGLEPFIDTLIVCTITALVILSSGVWNRAPVLPLAQGALVQTVPGQWTLPPTALEAGQVTRLAAGEQVFTVAGLADGTRARLYGDVRLGEDARIEWRSLRSDAAPQLAEPGVFKDYRGSTLAAQAFDSAQPGLGQWMVTLTVWLFALSTMITYGYYGEQGVVYFGGGQGAVVAYRWLWCALIFVTCLGFIRTAGEIDTLSTVALGFMLAVNLPTMLILGSRAMGAYHDYFRRLATGEIRRT